MAVGTGAAFQFNIRGDQREETPEQALHTERRDQQLEQFLWARYNHVCMTYRSGNQALGPGVTVILFNEDEHDPEAMHSQTVNTGRITCYIDGIWEFNAHVILLIGAAAAGPYFLNFRKTDTAGVITTYSGDGGNFLVAGVPILTAARMIPMKAGDYVEVTIDPGAFATTIAVDPGGSFGSPHFQAKYITSVKESGLQVDD